MYIRNRVYPALIEAVRKMDADGGGGGSKGKGREEDKDEDVVDEDEVMDEDEGSRMMDLRTSMRSKRKTDIGCGLGGAIGQDTGRIRKGITEYLSACNVRYHG